MLTLIVCFDLLLELLHLHVALFFFLLAAEGQRAKVTGFVLCLLFEILAHQRVLVVIGDA